MDIESVKNIALVAAPLTKVVLETFLLPKFREIASNRKREGLIIDHAFENKFLEYLNESYEKNAVLNTVAFKKKKVLLNDVYIPLTIRCEETDQIYTLDTIDPKLFSDNSKILITDTAGMGKSTVSRKLLISCIENNYAVPVLIELRRLSKGKGIIDEILEQINPINEKIDKQFILDLIKRGDFLFFLDGFDEISIAERSFVTKELQHFISKASKNKFILTSRPEEALSSFGDFSNFQIDPLEIDEAFELLRRYDSKGELAELLISKINEPENLQNIEEYLDTPLLVSLLFTAFEHKQRIPFKKHIFYRQVFDALYESHDLSKGDSFERDKYSGLGIDEFHRVLRILGYLCLKNDNRIEFNRDELDRLIQQSKLFCDDLEFQPSDFIKDILITVPIFVKDGVYLKWSHKSLQEYFSAQFVYLDSKEKQKEILRRICFHNDNLSYLNVIDLYYSIDPKGFEQIVTYKLLQDYFHFIDSSYRHFNGVEKLVRQELEFGHILLLINFPFKPPTKQNHPRELFNLIHESGSYEGNRRSIRILGGNEKDLSFIKVPQIKNSYQTLIEFLHRKNCNFTSRKDMKPKIDQVDLKLVPRKIYKVSDRKNAFLNKNDNFKKTNEIIKHFIYRRGFTVINQKDGRQRLKVIKESIQKSNDDDFLLI